MSRLSLFFAVLCLLSATLCAGEKQRFVLYAMLTETTPVVMADGSKWEMDKGDTFPLLMFKEQQTKVVLQLAGTSFWVDAKRVKVIEEKDVTQEQLATYRNNVKNYIQSRSEEWKSKAKAAK